jgi:tRNA-dihydrouridine synthase B
MNFPFSPPLQNKIDTLIGKRTKVSLGKLTFPSHLLLAPMAGICTPPFRLLMQDLGAGGMISELVSSKGISYKNDKTLKMLQIDPREQNTGLQLFGNEPEVLREAALIAESFGARFIDLNMGCPVRKVVTKGGGSALLDEEPQKLAKIFQAIKKAITIPLSIKIRTGLDQHSRNADKILRLAKDEGVEFASIHGRTRSQFYQGEADWDYIEALAQENILPLVGNGDLNLPTKIGERWHQTHCQALMLGRGPLQRPFLFLEGLSPGEVHFVGCDYLEVIRRYIHYLQEFYDQERIILLQLKKQIVWIASSFPGAAAFRQRLFNHCSNLANTINLTEEYFISVGQIGKDPSRLRPPPNLD